MKQRRLFKSPALNWVFMLSAVTLLTMPSCGIFNRGSSQSKTAQGKVPTSYNKAGTPRISTQEARIGYIDRFKRIAISEMERTGVPASIKLAQGLLESDAGRSTLSSNYNNHFGIKCHSTWQGERFYKEDDDIDPLTGQLIKSCFRAYKNADESFIAHSEFLRDPAKVNRYGSLFQLQRTDYVGWAQGLQRSGYATAQDYSDKLIRLIQDYQLAQYDNLSLKDVATNINNSGNGTTRPNDDFPVSSFPSGNTNQPTTTNTNPNTSWLPGWENAKPEQTTYPLADTEGERNNVKYARAYGQMTPYELAGKYGVSIANLQSYNEELPDPRTPLADGAVIYLQKKRNYWRGAEKTYKIRDCETMYDVSQKFGIKLSKLYSKNVMREGEQPAVGQSVLLRRGWFEGADKPALRDTFGEWRRCKMDTSTIKNPNVVTYPPITTPTLPGNNSGLGFEVTPNNGQPSPNNNPQYYPPSTYPSTTPTYPSTTPTYPSTTPTYPSTTPTYPSTTPTYPSTTPTYPSKPATSPSPTPAGAQYHTVDVKETLWAISRKYGLTVDALKQLNGLTDNLIKPGQQLRVK